jgi:hypothetical protein
MEVEEIPAAEMDEGAPSTRREEPISSALTDFALLQGQLDRVERDMKEVRERQTAMMDTQTEMMVMLQELSGHQPPPADLAP